MAIAQEIKKQEQDMFSSALFYFASFGAASIVSFFATFLLRAFLRVAGVEISVSSAAWIFLFLLPAALALAAFFVARAVGGRNIRPLYGIIAGYGVYSILSFVIMIFSSKIEPMSWFMPILVLTALAVFYAEAILRKVKAIFTRVQAQENTAESPSRVEKKESDNENSAVAGSEKNDPILLIGSPESRKQK